MSDCPQNQYPNRASVAFSVQFGDEATDTTGWVRFASGNVFAKCHSKNRNGELLNCSMDEEPGVFEFHAGVEEDK